MNEQLNTFIHVAEAGSFSKAADRLFISPTAVMKQVNSLEKQVGIPLLNRTNHGVELTEAGKSFSKDAAFILQYFHEALQRTRYAAQASHYAIRVGTSMLNPCKVLLDMWNEIRDQYPQFKINIVHFEDDTYKLPTTYRTIGKHFDFIVGPALADKWRDHYRMLELGSYRFCVAVTRYHRLASQKILAIEDLYGEKLVFVNGGNSPVIEEIRNFVAENHPKIKMKNIMRLYDLEVFNRCEEGGAVLLTLDAWADIHPSLVTIPVDWDFTIPYGLLYPLHPSEEVSRFIGIMNDNEKRLHRANELTNL